MFIITHPLSQHHCSFSIENSHLLWWNNILYTAYSIFFVVYSTKLIFNLYQRFFLCRPGNKMHNSYLFQDLQLYTWLNKYMHPPASGENCGENKPCIWTTIDTTGKWIDVSYISVVLLMSVNICNWTLSSYTQWWL
jgi:hypothetical protein